MAGYPTHISLKNLPTEGESLTYSEKTGELTEKLEDLIENQPYKVDLSLRPLGNAYEITGKIETSLNTLCSRCGRDMIYPIEDQFTELIIIESERSRGGHSGHTGLKLDEGPFCNHFSSPDLDIGEFIHEHMVSSEPYILECKRSDCEDIVKNASQRGQKETPSEVAPAGKSPFSALKDLKV